MLDAKIVLLASIRKIRLTSPKTTFLFDTHWTAACRSEAGTSALRLGVPGNPGTNNC